MKTEQKNLNFQKALDYLTNNNDDIRILYVEDNEDVRTYIEVMLKKIFNEVIVCSNGMQGYEKYREYENHNKWFDLIITDINMPKMNGIEMIKKIKVDNPTQPFLVLSAVEESKYLIETIMLGVNGYLLKPIEHEQFISTLASSVEKIILKKKNHDYQISLDNKNKELKKFNNELELKVKQRTQELENKLYIDDLTGLKNKFALDIDIKKTQFPVLILVDIDSFHSINEFFGRDKGDFLLVDFTKRLKEVVSSIGYDIYRVSSDQFALLKKCNFINLSKIENNINRLFDVVESKAFKLDSNPKSNETIELTITAGIVLEYEKTLNKADMALHYAKDNNKKYSIYHFNIDFSDEITNVTKWLKILRKAIRKDFFTPFFQPIVDRDQNIIKYEVLMRLISQEDGINDNISPETFLPIAVKTKLYRDISFLIIQKSLKLIENNKEDISINLSYQDIENTQLVNFFRDLFYNKEIAKQVIFEIVESEQIIDFDLLSTFTKEFKCLGVRIAIDDFGTGYSNFAHIIKIKPDYLKIDGSLIKNIDTNLESLELVKAIVQFSKELGIKTIAEYIHSKKVFDIALEIGVDEFQGYYFGKPLPKLIA